MDPYKAASSRYFLNKSRVSVTAKVACEAVWLWRMLCNMKISKAFTLVL